MVDRCRSGFFVDFEVSCEVPGEIKPVSNEMRHALRSNGDVVCVTGDAATTTLRLGYVSSCLSLNKMQPRCVCALCVCVCVCVCVYVCALCVCPCVSTCVVCVYVVPHHFPMCVCTCVYVYLSVCLSV